jgi:4-hydroxy-2-oxoheptanedioate aldolase
VTGTRPFLAERIAGGDTACGVIVKMPAPALVELAGHTGFDLVVIDTEHGSADDTELEHHLRAADSAGIPALVRVGRNDPLLILHALDAGAAGVIVPHVCAAEDAQAAVRAAHYPPTGRRGLALSTRAGRYGARPLHEHLTDAAESTIVVAQVEDADAVPRSAQIAATPGLNAVWFGPSDLSLSLGLPGQLTHPTVAGAIDHIAAEVTASAHCALCVLVDSADEAAAWRQRGARIVLFSSTAILARQLRQLTGLTGADVAAAPAPSLNSPGRVSR